MSDMTVCCADIGSVKKGKFGWASNPSEPDADHASPRSLVEFVAERLQANLRVALGFECPLWIPIDDEPARLTCGRDGEGDRAWSAGAGACSLATGLTEVTWILDQIRRETPDRAAFLDWEAFEHTKSGLFIWEAFVTASAKADSDQGDAQVAIDAFNKSLPDPRSKNALTPTSSTRSLVGGALIWSGWTRDLKTLSEPCIVIKA